MIFLLQSFNNQQLIMKPVLYAGTRPRFRETHRLTGVLAELTV